MFWVRSRYINSFSNRIDVDLLAHFQASTLAFSSRVIGAKLQVKIHFTYEAYACFYHKSSFCLFLVNFGLLRQSDLLDGYINAVVRNHVLNSRRYCIG